jgi:predicted glycoside hydrolase/deacetylase ChbG (UPF0249 family)
LKILNDNKQLVEKIAELLFDKEYLTREEFLEMMSHPEKIDETIIKYRKSHAKKVAILEKTKLANEAKNLKKSK